MYMYLPNIGLVFPKYTAKKSVNSILMTPLSVVICAAQTAPWVKYSVGILNVSL
jgi:hypothetical protein